MYKNEKLSENNNKIFIIDEPMFKILNPEWKNFVHRNRYCDEIMRGINDKRTSIVSITGIGGIGKTALATWAVLQAYEKKIFKFIVSVTAKDRELAQHGINAIFLQCNDVFFNFFFKLFTGLRRRSYVFGWNCNPFKM